MKKILIFITLAITIFACSCGHDASVGIIGGADGPTAVTVTSDATSGPSAVIVILSLIVIGVVSVAALITVAVIIITKNK